MDVHHNSPRAHRSPQKRRRPHLPRKTPKQAHVGLTLQRWPFPACSLRGGQVRCSYSFSVIIEHPEPDAEEMSPMRTIRAPFVALLMILAVLPLSGADRPA